MEKRSKRKTVDHEGSWDCSVCTYKNSQEAFKCEMCDVRKGTSTRKPVLNRQQLQVTQQYAPQPLKKKSRLSTDKAPKEVETNADNFPLYRKPRVSTEKGPKEPSSASGSAKKEKNNNKRETKEKASTSGATPNGAKKTRPPRLKNIDRSSGTSMEVTVGNVTVVITDYKPKRERSHSVDTPFSNNSATNSTVTSPVNSPSSSTKPDVNGTDTDNEDHRS